MSETEPVAGSQTAVQSSTRASAAPTVADTPPASLRPAQSSRFKTAIIGAWGWCIALIRKFFHGPPHEQLATLYYGSHIATIAGAGVLALAVALWSFGSFVVEKGLLSPFDVAFAKGNTQDDADEALERVQKLIDGLNELRVREPQRATEIDAALYGIHDGKPGKAEALLQQEISRSKTGDNATRQRTARLQVNLAAVLYADSKAKALVELRAAVDLDPVSYEAWFDLGNVAQAAGELGQAADAFEKALALALDQMDTWREAISWLAVGDVQLARGGTTAAENAYNKSFDLVQGNAKGKPNSLLWNSGLSRGHKKKGDILKERHDASGALDEYRLGREILENLLKRYPKDTQLWGNLSVILIDIGSVRKDNNDPDGALKDYRSGLEIVERLAQRKPRKLRWERYRAACHEAIGDVLKNKGEVDLALVDYRRGLAITEELVGIDQTNMEWQRDRSAINRKIGDILLDKKDRDGARKAYQNSLGALEKLAAIEMTNMQWQLDLVLAHRKLIDLDVDRRANLEAIVRLLEPLEKKGPLSARQREALDKSREDLLRLN